MDRFDGGEVAIGNAKRFVGRCELDAVAYGEFALDLPVDADAGEAARIVGGRFSVRFFDNEQVCGWIDPDDRCIGGGFDSVGFAATCVANYVVDLVVACLGSVGSGHVLRRAEGWHVTWKRRRVASGSARRRQSRQARFVFRDE